MAKEALRTAIGDQASVRALKDGDVVPDGHRLAFEPVTAIVPVFRRMVRELPFDVSEMAFSTYLCAREHGVPFTALPLFLVRGLHHGAILTAGVTRPADLEGRRVGVNRGYTVTTGVWARGILQDEHGVDLHRITWVPSDDEHVTSYKTPPEVAPFEPRRDLADLLVAGDLAAVAGAPFERAGVAPLIPDPEAAALAALRDRGFYPINHLVVVRDDVLAARPDLAPALFHAFAEAKRRYLGRLGDTGGGKTERLHRAVSGVTGDPLPHGIAPNRAMIDLMVEHCLSQGILDTRVTAEEIFPPSTHDLVG